MRSAVTNLLRIWSKRRRIPKRVWELLTYRWRCALWRMLWKWTRRELTVKLEQGIFSFRAGPDEAIGECLYCARHFELDTMANVKQLLETIDHRLKDPKATIVDVGANVGVIAIGFIKTGLAERAIAIEVDLANFAFLRRNVAQNRLEDRVLCLPFAATDRTGHIELELSPINSGDHRVRAVGISARVPEIYGESARKTVTLPCDTLDNLVLGSPDLFRRSIAVLWIDVQGHEYHALRGAHAILSSGVPVVAEFWPYGMQRAGVSREDYCHLARQYWSHYWLLRRCCFGKCA